MKEGFEKCEYEHTLFIKIKEGGEMLIVYLYVDDLIFTRNDELTFIEFKNSIKHEFDMTNVGKMRYFLGLEVIQKFDGIFLNQDAVLWKCCTALVWQKNNFVRNSMVPGTKLLKDENGVKVDKTYFKQIVASLIYLTAT